MQGREVLLAVRQLRLLPRLCPPSQLRLSLKAHRGGSRGKESPLLEDQALAGGLPLPVSDCRGKDQLLHGLQVVWWGSAIA